MDRKVRMNHLSLYVERTPAGCKKRKEPPPRRKLLYEMQMRHQIKIQIRVVLDHAK
jgi:hypothetical protein